MQPDIFIGIQEMKYFRLSVAEIFLGSVCFKMLRLIRKCKSIADCQASPDSQLQLSV